MVRLGYSTYAMREVDVFDAPPRLRAIDLTTTQLPIPRLSEQC